MRPSSLISLISLLVAAPISIFLPGPSPLLSILVLAQSTQAPKAKTIKPQQAVNAALHEANSLFERGTKQQAQQQNDVDAKIAALSPLENTVCQSNLPQSAFAKAEKLKAKRLLRPVDKYLHGQEESKFALDRWQQALAIYQRIGDCKKTLEALTNISAIYSDAIEQPEQALQTAQKTLLLVQKTSDYELETSVLRDLSRHSGYTRKAEVLQPPLTGSDQRNWGWVFLLLSMANQRTQAEKSLKFGQRALEFAQKTRDQRLEAQVLIQSKGEVQFKQKQYDAALKSYERAFTLYQSTQDIGHKGAIATLIKMSRIYIKLDKFDKAIGTAYQAWLLVCETGNYELETSTLGELSDSFNDKTLQEGLTQGLAVVQRLNNSKHRALALSLLSKRYEESNQTEKSIELGQQALNLARQIGDRRLESLILLRIMGEIQFNHKQYAAALEFYQKALSIYQQIKDNQGQLETLMEIEETYYRQNNIDNAIEYAKQVLSLAQKGNDEKVDEKVLDHLSEYYLRQASYGTTIKYAKQLWEYNPDYALDYLRDAYEVLGAPEVIEQYQIRLKIEDAGDELAYQDRLRKLEQAINLSQSNQHHWSVSKLNALGELGDWYHEQGDRYKVPGSYTKAIHYFEQGIEEAKKIHDSRSELYFLRRLASIYQYDLKNYPKAIELYKQAIPSISEISEKSFYLRELGNAYEALGNISKAVPYYEEYYEKYFIPGIQKDSKVTLRLNDKGSSTLRDVLRPVKSLIDACTAIGNPQKAIEYGRQALSFTRQSQDIYDEKIILHSLGFAYQAVGNTSQALEVWQQELALAQKDSDRNTQVQALNSIANLLVEQNRPELGIVFYKISINTIQAIRQDLDQLPIQYQKFYTHKVENTYRALADLLLAQGRISEAQQVLELLKVQELKNFTRSAEVGNSSRQVIILKPEQEILQRYGTLVAFGQKLNECERTGKVCKDLRDELDRLTSAFNQDSNVFTKELRERLAKDPAFLTADQLSGTATDIVTAESGTVLVYPLVLPNKLRILLAVKAGQGVAFRSFEVSVGQRQLWETVAKFREQISTPHLDRATINATSQQLYDWLIRPLEAELQGSHIHHLVFALDRSTRYIPMAALYDKQTKQYLIEKYAISTILSAELTDVRDHRPLDPNQISVLALGASDVQGFNPLPNVPAELAAIVGDEQHQIKGIFQGQKFLNQTFDYDALRDHLAHRQIVHIASHAAFEKNAPEQSFILLGTGERLTIESIQQLQNYMRQVDLVVLSACQTAVGGPDESGIEVPGISFYFLRNKVKSVMASLWEVSDSSTSLLMQQFYQNLATGKMTKAEALRQAQLSLLQGKLTATDASRRSPYLVPKPPPGTRQLPANNPTDFSHPYYWAPFILIGDGL